jgi:alpha-D-xyloside xylohydrolase
MNKRCLVFAFLVMGLCSVWAQSYQKTELGVKTSANSTAIEIQVYSPSIVRVLKSPEGKPFKKESLSVIKTPQKGRLYAKFDKEVSYTGKKVVVKS